MAKTTQVLQFDWFLVQKKREKYYLGGQGQIKENTERGISLVKYLNKIFDIYIILTRYLLK